MPDHLDRQPYGQSFSSVPQELVSEDRYGPTPDGPLLPRGLKRPRRSSPRLRSFNYTGPYAYSLTLNADGNRRCFVDDRFTSVCVSTLLKTATECQFEILAYCFMPNHAHILVKGLDGTARLKPFVQRFKQVLGYAYELEYRRPLWQRSFYDHIARTDEYLERSAAYIWGNPVRAGIVERIEDYRWSGPRERIAASSGRSGSVRNVAPNRGVGGQSLSSVPTGGRGPRERIESGSGRPGAVREVKRDRGVGGQSSSFVPTPGTRSGSVRDVKRNRGVGGQSLSSVPTPGPRSGSVRDVKRNRGVGGQSSSSVPTPEGPTRDGVAPPEGGE